MENRICKSEEPLIKEREDNDKKEKIRELMDKIKKNELFDSDISKSIINCFIINNFCSLNIDEIIDTLNNSIKFGTNSQKYNLRNDVMDSLKNKILFYKERKKHKYDLNLEKTVNYLTSFLGSNSNSNNSNSNSNNSDTNSKKSKRINSTEEKDNNRISPVFDFPKYQNDVVYMNPVDNQQTYSDMDDNSFTFGEQSQIKIIKKNKKEEDEVLIELNEEDIKKLDKNNISKEEFNELENKAIEKDIPEFEYIFGINNYLSNYIRDVEKFFKLYKEKYEKKANFNELENDIKKIYSLNEELEFKRNSFNKLTSIFNEEKEELFNIYKIIQKQFKLLKTIIKIDFIENKFISNEKENIKYDVEEYKKLFDHFREIYTEIKSNEKEINKIISDIKFILKGINDRYIEKKEEYQKFCEMIKNIENIESIPIKVNINETVKLFYYYINEFEKFSLDLL